MGSSNFGKICGVAMASRLDQSSSFDHICVQMGACDAMEFHVFRVHDRKLYTTPLMIL